MFSILTYNTHLFGGIGEASAFNIGTLFLPLFEDEQRTQSLIGYLNNEEQTADLVGLSEVWATKNKEAIIEGAAAKYPHAFFAPSSTFSVGDGLLLLSKHPLQEKEFHKFVDRAGDDQASEKGIVSAKIVTAETIYQVFLTHTQAAESSQDKTARAGNLQQIRDLISSKGSNPNDVVILLGDLNVIAEDSDGKPTAEYVTVLEPLMRSVGLVDGFRQKSPDAMLWPGFTFDGPENDLVGEFSPEEQDLRQRLDYVFTSAVTEAVEVKKPTYLSPGEGRELSLSDHYGMFTQINPALTVRTDGGAANYQVVIETIDDGPFGNAGTDSNIFLTMWGETGFATDEIRLNGLLSGNIFEGGDVDVFNIEKGGLGNIKQIRLRSEGNDDWEPKSVTILNPDGSKSQFAYGNVEINKNSSAAEITRQAI